ncbi:uncharacterized protein isoform X1 [Rhodnius prolixus]|uniref:uncharacterized protein isoform X1 n=1 Tax=Rhodnius prolixus TaxID=13249 RepID=UPI003D18F0AB
MSFPSSTYWQSDSKEYKADNYNEWFTLCAEAIKCLDRLEGVSVDEIKSYLKKRRIYLNDTQISVALIRGLSANLIPTKSGKFLLSNHLKRNSFVQNKEKIKAEKVKSKKKKLNKKKIDRAWRHQFSIDVIRSHSECTDEIQKQKNLKSSGACETLTTHVTIPPDIITSREVAKGGELQTDSEDVEYTRISYPAYYNHIDETKQINLALLKKRKWLKSDRNKQRVKKMRIDKHQSSGFNKLNGNYSEVNMATTINDSCERWRGEQQKDWYQDDLDEYKPPRRKVEILEKKLNDYCSNVTSSCGSDSGIKYPKAILQKYSPSNDIESWEIDERELYDEKINEHLIKNVNFNVNNDCLECLKRKIKYEKKKNKKQKKNKEDIVELEILAAMLKSTLR